jgi:hypothetical protein
MAGQAIARLTETFEAQTANAKPGDPVWQSGQKGEPFQGRKGDMATPAGFEPATFSLEGCCSIP